ncbi:MAG: hypothetical protein ABWX69_06290 [Arthrobacter sp.]
MRTATRPPQADQARHLSEQFITQLTKGREWATPGVEAALRRLVAGLDAGIESASPRTQANLRRLADELAGGVETLAPRVHEGLKRVAPKVVTVTPPAKTKRTASGKVWWIGAALAIAVSAGVAAWFSFRPGGKEPLPAGRRPGGADPDSGAPRTGVGT